MIIKMTAHKAKPNKLLHYANDKTKYNDTYNMTSSYKDKLEKKIREFNKFAKDNNLGSRKYYHLILSPKPNEQNNDPEKLLDYARKLLNDKFPDSMATISIHKDKKDRIDCHIVMSAWKIDGSKIDIKNKEYDKIKTYAQDTLARQCGYEPITKEQRIYNHKRLSQAEEALKKKGKETQPEYIRKSVREVLKREDIIDEASFKKALEKYHITYETYKTKNNEIRVSYKTPDLKYGISELKLGDQFSITNIKDFLNKKVELIKKDEALEKHEEKILDKASIKSKYNDIVPDEKKEALKELKDLIKKHQNKIPDKHLDYVAKILQGGKGSAGEIKKVISLITSLIKTQTHEYERK